METSSLGKMLLIFCAVCIIATYLLTSLSWILISAGLLVLFIYSRNRFIEEVSGSRLRVEHRVLDAVAYSHEPVAFKVEVANRSVTSVQAQFEARIPEDCSVVYGSNIASVTIPPRSTWSYTYSLVPGRRGQHVIGGIVVEQTDAFGMFIERREIDAKTVVNVHTRRESLARAREVARREHFEYAGMTRTPTVVVREFEHDGIRDYVPGDKARDIHWKVYTKLGKLMTKTYKKEGTLETVVFIDCGRSMRLALGEVAKIDHAVDLGIQLSRVLLSNYHRTGAMAFDETSVVTGVEPSLGKHQFEKIVRALREAPGSVRTNSGLAAQGEDDRGTEPVPNGAAAARTPGGSEAFFEALRTMRSAGPERMNGIGLDGAVGGMIAKNRRGQMLFVVISDLISSREAVVAAARSCRGTGNRVLVIQTYDDWYTRATDTMDAAEVERLYRNMEVDVRVEAMLRRLGASFIRIGPADTTARIVRSVRRGVA